MKIDKLINKAKLITEDFRCFHRKGRSSSGEVSQHRNSLTIYKSF